MQNSPDTLFGAHSVDRARCIEGTIAQMPSSYVSVGWWDNKNTILTFEEKVFGKDFIPGNGSNKSQALDFSLQPVEERLRIRTAELLISAPNISNEGLLEQVKAENLLTRSLGKTLVRAASPFGLVRALSAEQAASETNEDPKRLNTITSGDHYFSSWTIQPSTARTFILLSRAESARKSKPAFEAVDLDDLFLKDPDAVKSALVNYHTASNMSALLYRAVKHLSMHEIDPAQVLPNIAQAIDRENYGDYISLISHISLIGLDPAEALDRVVRRYNQSMVQVKQPAKEITDVYYYANHIEHCPGSSEPIQDTFSNYSLGLRLFRAGTRPPQEAIDIYRSVAFEGMSKDEEEKILGVLRRPIINADEISERRTQTLESEQSQRKQLLDLLNLGRSASYEGFLSLMQEHAPIIYKQITEFQKWVDARETYEGTRFEGILKSALPGLSSNPPYSSYETAFEWISKTVGLVIPDYSTEKGENFPGISKGYGGSKAYFRGVLGETLVALAIKKLAGQKQVSEKGSASVYQEIVDKITESVNYHEEEIRRDKARKYQQRGFLLNAEIRQSDVSKLLKAAGFTTKDDLRGNPTLYTLAFNLLYMEKQGSIDIESPIVEALLKDISPDKAEKLINTLREIVDNPQNPTAN